MFNGTKSRSTHSKICKIRKSLFLIQFIKKNPKAVVQKCHVKIRKTRKKTPEMESFLDIVISLRCAPTYKNRVHSDSIEQ